MKKEILYLGLDVHAENIAVALASVILSAVRVSSACGVCHHQICLTHIRLLVLPSPCESSAATPSTPRCSAIQSARSVCGSSGKEIHLATRSRKSYWRMSANSTVQRAFNKRWLKEQGVPELKSILLKRHHRDKARA